MFSPLARKALGLDGFEEDIPCAATYYNFRAALVMHTSEKGEDLLQKCFEQVTGNQAKAYGVSGRSERMDSKLIGSNIALYSRYVLVHKTMCKYLNDADISAFETALRSRIEEYLKEDAAKTVYRTDSETMKTNLLVLGETVYAILKIKEGTYPLLKQVFEEQYVVKDGVVSVRPKNEIPADSLQNPNDPDATYRNKNEHPIQVYSTNITETRGEEGRPSLITGVQVETATHADCKFLEEGVAQSECVTGDTVEKAPCRRRLPKSGQQEVCQNTHP